MEITAQLVKDLRERSGAGMMECKKALVQNGGDIEAAVEWLRKQGLAKADKKADRVAAEGRIALARAPGKAVLVEVNCETDFVAKDENFIKFTDEAAATALASGAANVDVLKSAKTSHGPTVEEGRQWLVTKIGENIQVRRLARATGAGPIGAYVHGGRIGVLVALAGGDDDLAKGIAMHVAAMNPPYIAAENVPADFLAREKEIALAQMTDKDRAKPAAILDRIVSGKVAKIINEVTLTGQAYVLDTDKSVGEVLKAAGARVESMQRLAVGEGIEKKEEDFAAEVMKQAGLA
ncbi:MAG: translation elongation factor Ts [Lysobacterales bacterium]